jgi:transcription elongation GreA/GreB family factor
MDFDRKTQRELNRLSAEAQRLWEEQRDVLAHAKGVARSASRQASKIAQSEVLPRAQQSYRENVEPLLAKMHWAKVAPVQKKSSNPVVFILMAIGAIALAAISYAAYQTLRADDDLWVEEDSE